uniref:Ras and Rab interactor-like n=1 Tax=Nothobranchius rachovii TaxID=451742 RepID=A0A1A8RY68_9TELE
MSRAVHSPPNGTTATPWRSSRRRLSLLEQLRSYQEAWCPAAPWDREQAHSALRGTPAGRFLVVRDFGTSRPNLLCVSAGDQNHDVLDYNISCTDTVFQLSESRLSFSELPQLLLFYCLTRDVLSVCLSMPGWIYSMTDMNKDGLSQLQPTAWLSAAPEEQHVETTTSRGLSNMMCSIQLTSTNGALCIINPLYIHEHGDEWLTMRGQRRLSSTRSWMGAGLQKQRAVSLEQESLTRSENSGLIKAYSADCPLTPPPTGVVLRRPSRDLQRASTGSFSAPSTPGSTTPEMQRHSSPVLQSPHRVSWIQDGFWLPPPRPASLLQPPSLELDSLSISSVEEEQESQMQSPSTHPPSARCLAGKVKNRLSAVGQVLGGLVSQRKKLTNRVQELSEKSGSMFAEAVKGFVDTTLKGGTDRSTATASDFLQEVRSALTSMKETLLGSPEMQSVLESITDLSDSEIDSMVELSLHRLALKPVSTHLYTCIHTSRTNDGSLQRLQSNFGVLEKSGVEELGGSAGAGVPDLATLDRIQQKWSHMHEAYSPNKKILILLKVCKSIYHSMSANGRSGTVFGADDFLPCLTWVLLRSDLATLQVDTDYMMELVDPTQLQGEGGYYLTTLYAALFYISSFRPRLAARQLSVEAQNSINQWHRRRTLHCHQSRRSKHRLTIRRQLGQSRAKLTSEAKTGSGHESGGENDSDSSDVEQQTESSSEAPQTLKENAPREQELEQESQTTASGGPRVAQQEVGGDEQEDKHTAEEED